MHVFKISYPTGSLADLVCQISNRGMSPDLSLPHPPPPVDPSEFDEQGWKRYMPSQTFKAVQEEVGLKAKDEEPGPAHSRTFKMLQLQLKRSGW